MLLRFLVWFIVFGLSFLVQNFGWTDQGTAFLYMYLGTQVLILIILAVLCLLGNGMMEAVIIGVLTAFMVGIILFATWGATQLFDVPFNVAYQIMTFGQCLYASNNKKK